MSDSSRFFTSVRRHRQRRAAAAVLAAGLAVAAAAAVPDASAAPAARTTIHFTARTVTIPASMVKKQLLSVSKDGSTYTFRSRTGALGKLKAGKVMFLQNLAVRDVSKAAMSHGHLVVHTTGARLTDLIANGTLTWKKAVSFTNGFVIGGSAVPTTARPAGRPTGTVASLLESRFGAVPLGGGHSVTVKGKTHSYSFSATFTSSAKSVSVKFTIGKSSPVEVNVNVTGTLQNLSSTGSVAVKNSHFASAKLLANHLTGKFELGYSAKPISAFGLGQAGGIKITLPAEIVVPVLVAGVPFFLGVKVAFFAAAGFSGFDQELSGSYTLTYSGQGGFSLTKSGATSAAGALKGLGKIILNAANAVGKGPLSFILGAQMPQLELGLGVKGLNVAGNLNLVGSTEIATNGPGCDTRKMEILGTAGAEANFFGFSTSLGTATLFDKTLNAAYPSGCGVAP
jgi:hypothetical protein